MVCETCNTTTLRSIGSIRDAELALVSASSILTLFKSRFFNSSSKALFPYSATFPALVIGWDSGRGRLCGQIEETFGRLGWTKLFGPALLNLDAKMCSKCMQGISLTDVFVALNSSHLLAWNVGAGFGNVAVAPRDAVVLADPKIRVTGALGENTIISGSGSFKIASSTVPEIPAAFSLTKSVVSLQVNLTTVRLDLGALLQALGVRAQTKLPDDTLDSKLASAGSVTTINGQLCYSLPPGNDSSCSSSIAVVAPLDGGRTILLDNGNFAISGVKFEGNYTKTSPTNATSIEFRLMATWAIGTGFNITAMAAYESSTTEPESVRGGVRGVLYDSKSGDGLLRRIRRTVQDKGSAVALVKRQTTRKFTFSLTSPVLPLGKLISSLALKLNPSLSFFEPAIGRFAINQFAMKAVYSNKTYQFRVSGKPSPVPAASFEFMGGSLGGDRVAAMALLVNTADEEAFGELTSSVGTAIDFTKVAVVSLSLSIGLGWMELTFGWLVGAVGEWSVGLSDHVKDGGEPRRKERMGVVASRTRSANHDSER